MSNWPTDRGPRKTLEALGLHGAEERLNWTRHSTNKDYADGTMYVTRPNFLRTDAVRLLAALTFEGYEVRIATNDESLKVTLYEKSIRND